MLGKSRLWVGLAALLAIGAPGCVSDGESLGKGMPEVVNAPAPQTMPGGRVAGRYWAEVDPKSGDTALFPIHPGNVIYRAERVTSAVNYNYANTAVCDENLVNCTSPDGTVTLFTDQNGVTFVEDPQGVDDGNSADDTCTKNGVVFLNDATCGGFYQAGSGCTRHNVFCAPLTLTSNITFGAPVGALPDVVVDVANAIGNTELLGCVRNSTLGGTGGICSDDGPAKVNPATSNLVPSIAPTTGLLSCDYCYGNKAVATATARPALIDAVISGSSAELAQVNTNTLALKVTDGNSFNVVITVYYAEPAVNAPGTQLEYRGAQNGQAACFKPSSQVSVVVKGGGFGPPAECLTSPLPASCPASGTPAAGRTIDLAGQPAQTPLAWSDNAVKSQILTSGFYGACPVTVTTPSGTVTSSDEIVSCANQYRDFTPGGFLPRSRFASGVVSDFLIVAGGLNPVHSAFSTNTIQVMPLPRCSGPSPGFTVLAETLPAGVGRYFQASTVANGGLYIIGGGINGNTCTNAVVRYDYAGGATGTFTTLANLPTALCQATAVTLKDSSNGREYIVVTGGTLRPVPRFPNTPALSAADLAPRASFVYDVLANTWATFTGPTQGLRRYNMAGAGYEDAVDPAENVAIFVGGVTAVTTGADPAVATVTALILSAGVPTFFASTSLPVVRSAAAVASRDGAFYVYGGAENASLTTTGRHSLFRLDTLGVFAGDPWTVLSPTGPGGRQGHALVLSNFDEPAATDLERVITVGGNDVGTLNTTAREYIP